MNKKNILTWIELDSSALKNNLELLRSTVDKDTKIAGVVKANAYGHGIIPVSKLLNQFGIDYFCVHSLEEALILKEQNYNKSILIMGYLPLAQLHDAIRNEFRMVLYNLETLNKALEVCKHLNKPAYFHLKVETGTNRQGIREDELGDFIQLFNQNELLNLEGIYTHFANIEDTTDHSYAYKQLTTFRQLATQAEKLVNAKIPITHAACSAATLLFPESHFDMVRPGISMYGFWPSKETQAAYILKYNRNELNLLKPVLHLKTKIGQIKTVYAGEYIGYGCTYKATRDLKIAILPVGYYDGYDRLLSNNSYVIINQQRAPIVGRVCMNIIMVDVSDIKNVAVEDEVVLIGQQGDEFISADYLASIANTINYEIVSRLGAHIPRIIV